MCQAQANQFRDITLFHFHHPSCEQGIRAHFLYMRVQRFGEIKYFLKVTQI